MELSLPPTPPPTRAQSPGLLDGSAWTPGAAAVGALTGGGLIAAEPWMGLGLADALLAAGAGPAMVASVLGAAGLGLVGLATARTRRATAPVQLSQAATWSGEGPAAEVWCRARLGQGRAATPTASATLDGRPLVCHSPDAARVVGAWTVRLAAPAGGWPDHGTIALTVHATDAHGRSSTATRSWPLGEVSTGGWAPLACWNQDALAHNAHWAELHTPAGAP